MDENEFLDDAKEELKRSDHLIFVSLKYTRTCDVLKHVMQRIINCIGFLLTALLDDLQQKNEIEEIPTAPIPKAKLVREKYPDDEIIQEMVTLFLLLRKLNREDFTRAREFRRHVTMTLQLNEENFEVNIDVTTEWYKRLKEFYAHIKNMIDPEEE